MSLGDFPQTSEPEADTFNVSPLIQTLTKAVKALEDKGIKILGVDINIRIAGSKVKTQSLPDAKPGAETTM